jgi:opine dehydrogenase
MEKVAVLGGGNAAYGIAADLSRKRVKVNMCELPEFQRSVRTIMQTQEIEVTGLWEGVHKINLVTTSIEEAVKDVELIIIAVPAFGQIPFAQRLLPHLEDGQIVLLSPGNFGSLEIAKIFNENRVNKTVTLAELNTSPVWARLIGPGKVHILTIMEKPRTLFASALPSRENEKVIKLLKQVYPAVTSATNVLEINLNNENHVIHPVGSILNAGAIELSDIHEGRPFYLYKEGISPGVARVMETVEKERIAISKKLGLSVIPLKEAAALAGFGMPNEDLYHILHHNDVAWRAAGPHGLKDRYIVEDIPYGLVPTMCIAEIVNVPVPTIRSLIHLASTLNQVDYLKEGRNSERLGISKLSVGQLKKFLEQGTFEV